MNNLHEKNNKNIVKMRDIETLKLKKCNKDFVEVPLRALKNVWKNKIKLRPLQP